MGGEAARVLFVFVDGVGLGPDDPGINPIAAARLPTFESLLGARPTLATAPRHTERASLVSLDATLGLPGLPQSGTGQTALLTGENAAELFGRHFGPWTPTSLRPLLAKQSVLARALAAGRRVAFANAYPEEIFATSGGAAQPAQRPRPRGGPPDPLRAGPPLAALGAGLLTRHTPELRRGDAVASDITNENWRRYLGRHDLPDIDAATAGRNLGRIAAAHDLTLFAHYTTDHAGHRGSHAEAVAAIERVDAFLGGVLETLPPDGLLLVASDHGNLEEIGRGHTRNPVLGLVCGPGHGEVAGRLRSITDVAPAILALLGAASA